jgi:serine/threonine-protein kinase
MNESQPTEPKPASDIGLTQSATPASTRLSPAAATVTASSQRGGLRYGRFAVQRLHAKGGLGEVHVAMDDELKRDVALKRMQDRFVNDNNARRRFLNEAEITAKLEHPGIVPIYGLVQDEMGEPCYAMRFIQGESLAEAIKRFHGIEHAAQASAATPALARAACSGFDSLPFRQLLQRFVSVCQTIAYAHSKNVIHRDLKPANVMLGPFGETLVVDWGLAKQLGAAGPGSVAEKPASGTTDKPSSEAQGSKDDTTAFEQPPVQAQTAAGDVVGTPAYMAPEQAQGQGDAVGTRSDIWSLGASLYEMLTGVGPYRGHDIVEVLHLARSGIVRAPHKLKAGVPRALEAICLKALARKSEDRYAAAKDLADELENWLADEPISAYEEPWPARAARWMRRHRGATATAAATLATAFAGMAIGLWAVDRERGKTEAALMQVTEEQAKTQSALNRARKALDRVTAQAIAENIGRKPQPTDADKRFLREVLQDYQDFTTEQGRTPEMRDWAAEGYFGVAQIRARLGERPEAQAAYQQANLIREQLVAEFPNVPAYRRGLARGHNNLGLMFMASGGRHAAKSEHQQAIALQTRLVEEFPTDTSYRHELAKSHNNLAIALNALGDRPGAKREYELALQLFQKLATEIASDAVLRQDLANCHHNLANLLNDLGDGEGARREAEAGMGIRQKLVADFGDVPDYRRDLAMSYFNLALILRQANDGNGARKSFRQAIDVLEPLAAEFPTVTLYSVYLGATSSNFGGLALAQGNFDEATTLCSKAIAILQPLVTRDPRFLMARQFLGDAFQGRAEALSRLRRHTEAAEDYARAAEVTEGADRTWCLCQRALALVHGGQTVNHAEAVAAAKTLAAAPDVTGARLYDLACVYAVASVAVAKNPGADAPRLAEEYAARAVKLLGQAFAKGYKDIEHLKKNDDLKALRERGDFKTWLKELDKRP